MKYEKNIEITHAAKSLRMDILEVGHAVLDKTWNYKDVTHSFSQIYIPLAGHGQYIIEDSVIDILPGKVYLVPAGFTYTCFCDNMLEKMLIDFSVLGPDGTDIFLGTNKCIVFEDTSAFKQRLQDIYSAEDLHSAIKLKLLLLEIIEEALAATPINTTVPRYSQLTKKALSYIDKHLSANLTITDIADKLFVSKLTLQKHFKEELGRPIGKYITERIMSKAERILLESDKSIREIANQLGFCDQFYFSRVFTQHYGMSPSLFRKLRSK